MNSDPVSGKTEKASARLPHAENFGLDKKKNVYRCMIACMNFTANGVASGLGGIGYFIISALRPDDLAHDGVRALACAGVAYGLNLIVGGSMGYAQGHRHYEQIKMDIAEAYKQQMGCRGDDSSTRSILEKMQRKAALVQCATAMVTMVTFLVQQNRIDIFSDNRKNVSSTAQHAQEIPKPRMPFRTALSSRL